MAAGSQYPPGCLYLTQGLVILASSWKRFSTPELGRTNKIRYPLATGSFYMDYTCLISLQLVAFAQLLELHQTSDLYAGALNGFLGGFFAGGGEK